MNLLICLITYNRLKYTKRSLKSLIASIDVPYYLVVVDNNSEDKTPKWLEENGPQDLLILNPYNFYPGRACNNGWERGLKEFPNATHLMRMDNDMEFVPGFASKAEQYFEAFPELGQLGLDDGALDSWTEDKQNYLFKSAGKVINMWPGNVGGPCIVRREAWDLGARYDETPWKFGGDGKPIATEDVIFSFTMHKLGYAYGHPTEKLGRTFADETNWKDYPEYYKKTLLERGFTDKYKEVFGDS